MLTRPHPFGLSTHLYHASRLSRDHLVEIAAAGFDLIELRATRAHFDYHNVANIADLQQWLAEAGVALRTVHAPLGESYAGGRWNAPVSIAAADKDQRILAVEETLRALHVARRIPFDVLILHLGVPRGHSTAAESRDAARQSVEEIAEAALPLGVRVAVEVIPNELSRVGSLTHFVEQAIEAENVGLCLDIGHAQLEGDVMDAIETAAEHLFAVDLHDNAGRGDDHLVPFDGGIDWPAALTAVQKVGYDGPLMIEVGPRGAANETLARARKARERLERLLAT